MDSTVGQAHGVDAARLREIEEVLAAGLADALDVDRQTIALDTPVSDLGVDSIAAVQWTRAAGARYSLAIPPARLFDHPTVRALARHVLETIAPAPSSSAAAAPAAVTP